jgi:hypothetical protein
MSGFIFVTKCGLLARNEPPYSSVNLLSAIFNYENMRRIAITIVCMWNQLRAL